MKCDGDASCPMCRSNLCDVRTQNDQISRLRTFNTDWAKVRLGVFLLTSESDFTDGLNLLMDSGADGLCQLAVYYQSRDEAKASFFLKRAAEAGSADACFAFSSRLGSDTLLSFYYLNQAVDKDHDEAWMWVRTTNKCGASTLGCGFTGLIAWAMDKLHSFDTDALFFHKRVTKYGSRKNYREWLMNSICSKIQEHTNIQ